MILKNLYPKINTLLSPTFVIAVVLSIICFNSFSQEGDSVKTYTLEEIVVTDFRQAITDLQPITPVNGTYITAGKKSSIISVSELPAHIAEKNGRQLFAKIPGAFIYDMDGSGNQINFSTRGLDPHRSWEYNIRQNGIMTNSDIYGYPASHYSPPLESIQKVEILRGTSSLQYGAQFGGMINYIVKSPDTLRKVGFESINSVGSFGLLSTYNALGGKIGRFSYYAYYHKRVSDGYRDNSTSKSEAQYISLQYEFSDKVKLKGELGRSTYLFQIPGPLTDSMFRADPKQATRSRNYFNPDIYIPSISLDWKINKSAGLNWTSSAVLGERNSVQFVNFANVPDQIDPSTGTYAPRQIDIDNFHSYSTEVRLRKQYEIGSVKNTLVTGVRYINNDMNRRQQGKGSTGSDFDLKLIEPGFGRDLHHKTSNVSFFLENLVTITPRLSVSPGVRVEYGESNMTGKIKYLSEEEIPLTLEHKFVLPGISGQYLLGKDNTIYAGWSQAYRPIVMADIIPPSEIDRTDDNLKDSFGDNSEIGIRGKSKRLTYDVSLFSISYRNRVGSLITTDEDGNSIIFKTNTGNSITNGVELYAEYSLIESRKAKISLFSATSYFDAKYKNSKISDGNGNKDISGNRLETVPKWISRNGLQFSYTRLSGVLQFSYVDESYSDAYNTETPSANGAKGIVPAYELWDLNLSCYISSNLSLRAGINNIFNKQYFTKRPAGYPGAGVWTSDGRGVNVTLKINL